MVYNSGSNRFPYSGYTDIHAGKISRHTYEINKYGALWVTGVGRRRETGSGQHTVLALASGMVLSEPGMVVPACNPRVWDVELGRLAQGPFQLHSNFKAS